MSLTLLLDLDDTLLVNDIQAFVPVYLQAFAREVAPYVDPEKFVEALWAGTRMMLKNRQPDRTLKEVFEATFYPMLGLEPCQFEAVADRFYKEVFPTLKFLTQPKPEATHLVRRAFERGFRIVVATNPMFPRMAVLHRLAWADLPVDRYPFDFVTSYEKFHFVKPDPAYYAEILAYLGWPDGPVVMVGDDLGLDISASRQLGLAAYWVPKSADHPPVGDYAPTATGKLEEFIPWLDRTPQDILKPNFNLPSAMIAILRSTPAVLDGLCRNLTDETRSQRPQPDSWSITEILCHLRDVDAEVHLPRIEKVISESNPFLPGMDTDPWAMERQYFLQDGLKAMQDFTSTRMKMVADLEALTVEGWNRPARHAIFGPTRLSELVSIIASHDRLHVQQVLGNLAGCNPALSF